MIEGQEYLHIYNRSTMNRKHRDEILEPYVCLFRDSVVQEFISMEDNESPIKAYRMDDYLKRKDIQRMDWPAMSPDMNPTEQSLPTHYSLVRK